jgi:hypothetical protein
MQYYFPSIIPSLQSVESSSGDLPFSVNSGENGIRLLLRSYKLPEGSRVVLPLFVCDSLKTAVLKEGLCPVYLDLKNDGTCWSDYHPDLLTSLSVSAVILVHLYGFIHPDTHAVMDFCRERKLPLLHDAAQSFGLDEAKLSYSSGIVYSFGPGKSSTAAGGAIVKGITDVFYRERVAKPARFQSLRASLFLKSRLYGYTLAWSDKLLQKLIGPLQQDDKIREASAFQKKAAGLAMKLVKEQQSARNKHYKLLCSALEKSKMATVIATGVDGINFKLILQTNSSAFPDYLHQHQVPFFSLYSSLHIGKEFFEKNPNFLKHAHSFIELSTEASLPEQEVERIAEVLSKA